MMKKLLSIIIFLVLGTNLFASHLVGGSLGYEYMGQFGSDYRYKIILVVYNNCDGSSQIPLPVATQPIAIYDHDISATNPMGGGNKSYVMDINLNLVDSNLVEPPVSSGCAVGQSVCIYKGVYEGIVDLPLSFKGYHLYFENFARNGAITNLLNPGGTAMAFHAYIPPTLVNNSSPVFSDDPVPFLCLNDTVSILNTAIDPDGDQLIFSFVTPMAGPGAGFPPNPLTWPITPVNYNPGYSTAQPFGAGGYSFINGATGLTQYMSPAIGNYVVAVEIREIRNGQLIGVSRRDLQLLVIACPFNPAPNLSSTGGSGTTQYTMQECDTLTFPVTFTDPNGDSLTLTTSGQIFDTSFVNPAASIDSLVQGDSTVTANFNWQTSCGTSQALPYQFTVSTTDNGCPPKTTNVVYQITVEPPTPPDSIIGPPLVCQNSTVTYSTDTINGYTFNWTVTNGNIVSGQGSTSVDVNWPNVGAGTVAVTGLSECGCPSITIDTAVTIIPVPTVDAGSDTNICLGDTIQIGGNPTGPIGTTFLWSPATNISNTTIANPMVWPTTTTSYIVTVDNGTCTSTDTITITVGSATIDAGPDTSYCLGDSTQLNATGGVSYTWIPSIGLSDTSIANPIANPVVTTTYFVTVVDSLGCTGMDSVVVTVNPIPIIMISNDTTVCLGTCVQLISSGGTNYNWNPGTGLSDSTIFNPVACPLNTTNYYLALTDSNNCMNNDSVMITINPAPTITTNNDTAVCDGNCVQLNAVGGVSYVWTPATGLSNDTIANPLACPTATTTYVVTGTDANGCESTDTVTITVNPLPTVDAGVDQGICVAGSVVIGGTPTGPAGSTYNWTPNSTLDDSTLANPTATPIITTTYTVTVTDPNGCSDFDVVTVIINPAPIVNAGTDTTICAGESIIIGGNPTGPASASYNWTPSATLNDNTLANPTATPSVTTEYIVTVTDSNNCVNTDSVTITVNPLPVITSSNDTSLCIGACYQLNASGGISYVWIPATGLSNDTISNPMACPILTTNYVVTGTDANGCFDTSATLVTVNPLPTIITNNDTSVCIGTCAQLTASGGTNYTWSPGGTLSDSTIFNPVACPTVTTNYTVTVTDANSCSDTSGVSVIIDPLPVVDAGVDTAICFGDTTQLNATGAVSYVWTPNVDISDTSIANPLVNPTTTTTYYVTGTDVNGCVNTDSVVVTVNALPVITTSGDTAICDGDCAQLFASGGSSYLWTPGMTLSDSTIFNPSACPSITTTYYVEVTGGGSGGNNNLIINGDFESGNTGFTSGLPLNCSCVASSYCVDSEPRDKCGNSLWTDDLWDHTLMSSSGNYMLIDGSFTNNNLVWSQSGISVINGNNYNFSFWVMPQISIGTGSQNAQPTFNIEINGNVIGTYSTVGFPASTWANYTTSWISNVTGNVTIDIRQINPISGFNDFGIDDISFFGSSPGVCVNTDSLTVTVNPLPIIDAGVDQWLCSGDTTQLNATGGTGYLWTPSIGLSDTTIANPLAFPLDTTDYIVTGTDANGCSNADTVQIIVNDEVPINPGLDTTICAGDTVMLGGMPVSPNGTSFSWFPNGGTLDNDTLPNPMAFPTVTTTYYVVATNDTCTAIDSVTITVNPPPSINAGADINICMGDTAQLNASGGVSYLWTPGALLNDSTIDNPLGFPTTTTEFVVVGTDTNGCLAADSVIVIVNPLPTISAGSATSVCFGDSVQLNASGGISYVWTPSTGLSNDTIANPLASPPGTTTYIVVGTDIMGCTNTDSVMVTINQLVITDLSDTTICIGDALQLNVNGPPGATYSWSPSTDLSDTTIANPFTTTQVNITYIVTVQDTNGCTDTTSVLVVAESKPNADFTVAPSPSCDGMLVDFTNLSTGATSYLWNFGDGDQSSEINPSHIFDYGSAATVILTSYSLGLCSDTSSYPISSGNFEDYFNLIPPTILTPNGDGLNDLFKMDVPDEISNCVNIQIFNRWGMLMYESNGLNEGWDGRTTAGEKVPVGTYFYIIEINGITKKGSLTLLE